MRHKAAEDIKRDASKRIYCLIFAFKMLARRQVPLGCGRARPRRTPRRRARAGSVAVQVHARVPPSLPPPGRAARPGVLMSVSRVSRRFRSKVPLFCRLLRESASDRTWPPRGFGKAQVAQHAECTCAQRAQACAQDARAGRQWAQGCPPGVGSSRRAPPSPALLSPPPVR